MKVLKSLFYVAAFLFFVITSTHSALAIKTIVTDTRISEMIKNLQGSQAAVSAMLEDLQKIDNKEVKQVLKKHIK